MRCGTACGYHRPVSGKNLRAWRSLLRKPLRSESIPWRCRDVILTSCNASRLAQVLQKGWAQMEIGVITNPNSRKNRNRPDRAERLRRIVGTMGEVHETSSIASIKPVLREFLRKQARYWVADGGDGALHWMLRMGMEVLQEDEFAGKSVTLPMTLPTKGGTIDFVANNVGIEGNAEGILAMLRKNLERNTQIEDTEVDSMAIDGIQVVDGVEVPFRTYGFASAAGGVGQRFYAKYYSDSAPNPPQTVRD